MSVKMANDLVFISGPIPDMLVAKSTMAGMLAGYLGMIAVLRMYMRGRTPYTLTLAMQVYNIAQIALNIYMIYGLVALVSFPSNIFGINLAYTANLEWFVYIHYLSKYLDFFDTLFIILRGKEKQQLSFLHVYHHASIGMIWGAMLHIGHGNGTAAFGALINSCIHCMMYSHYLWTSFGWNNPFKKMITQAQLVQFATCIIHAVTVLAYETVLPQHMAWAQFVYHIQMLVLFGHFYRKSYIAAREAKKEAKLKAK
ncbi:ELO family [Baffinella frigidus]|nr:ELO family [Cryptophyta sp. CCMP2293]|mmetsp:Transcript_10983/g.26658  ORF Transcript_10983/g.26658 Transcript_10983/m.26658 type:complete len:255 (-) Transcript_10983:255-1019(-)